MPDAERERLAEDSRRERNWKRWGPYLSERQWGTVREDYSESGAAWDSFPHDHARSRTYRWGGEGLLGGGDRAGPLWFSLARGRGGWAARGVWGRGRPRSSGKVFWPPPPRGGPGGRT